MFTVKDNGNATVMIINLCAKAFVVAVISASIIGY